jgi:hypothetical protein
MKRQFLSHFSTDIAILVHTCPIKHLRLVNIELNSLTEQADSLFPLLGSHRFRNLLQHISGSLCRKCKRERNQESKK